MNAPRHRWFDDDAGPVVRPYAVTRGRTRAGGEPIDVVSVVVGDAPATSDRHWLDQEHLRLLTRCREPIVVADLASDLDLPLGVVRVLIADLRERGLVTVHAPEPPTDIHDERILRTVLDELHLL